MTGTPRRSCAPLIWTASLACTQRLGSWRAPFWGWDSLFVYAIRRHVGRRRRFTELLARPELAHLQLVRLRSPAAVEAWLETVDAAAPPDER